MKKFKILLFILLCIIPISVHAIIDEYEDKLHEMLNIEVE